MGKQWFRRTLRGTTAFIAIPLMLGQTGCQSAGESVEGPGVDMQAKILYVGVLNDESGPAAGMGRPFAQGLRTLAHQINSGESDLLPPGWRVRLVERDHGYDPQRAVQQFEQTHHDVLFYLSVLGTPSVMALRPSLEEHDIIAFPASGSSLMAEHEHTPPSGASYRAEAMRGMDYLTESGQTSAQPRVAVIYQRDDYGQDGRQGWVEAAGRKGIQVVAQAGYRAGQTDFSEIVTTLREAEAEAVLLATLPDATARILTTATGQGYHPVWVGNSAAWSDRLYNSRALPEGALDNTRFVASGPFWGEDSSFVSEFTSTFDAYTQGRVPRDNYVLAAYVAAQVPFEAFRRALARGDTSRAGYRRALRSISDFNMDGVMPEPLDYTRLPYQPTTLTRVLQPDPANRSFAVVGDYARPESLTGLHAAR